MIKAAVVFDGPEREKKEENMLPGQVSDPPCSAGSLPHLPVSSPDRNSKESEAFMGLTVPLVFSLLTKSLVVGEVGGEAVSGRLAPLSWVLHMGRGSLEASTDVPALRSFPFRDVLYITLFYLISIETYLCCIEYGILFFFNFCFFF